VMKSNHNLTQIYRNLLMMFSLCSMAAVHFFIADEQQHKSALKKPFPFGVNVRFLPDIKNKQFIIFLKQISILTKKEELDIAHELGHLWLFLCNFSLTIKTNNKTKQEAYDTFFGLLLDIMARSIFYSYILDNYKINLYEVANSRLIDYVENIFPGLNNTSKEENLCLTLYYLKYIVESDDQHWRSIMHKAYSNKTPDNLKIIEDSLLPIIHELENEPNPVNIKEVYRAVLEVLEINSVIPRELWLELI
jgi:hypothetical protein